MIFMKIMQIVGRFCHWDATKQVPTLAEARVRFAPDMVFVEAPDYVFPGWGYDASADGDARFIRPEVPVGWKYDDDTGTLYSEDTVPPSEAKDNAELTAENKALQNTITELELALCDVYEAMLSVTGG